MYSVAFVLQEAIPVLQETNVAPSLIAVATKRGRGERTFLSLSFVCSRSRRVVALEARCVTSRFLVTRRRRVLNECLVQGGRAATGKKVP